MRKFLVRLSTGIAGTAATGMALAQSAYDPITTAVDWSDVGTAVVGIFAAIAVVYVTFKGGKKLLQAIKGA